MSELELKRSCNVSTSHLKRSVNYWLILLIISLTSCKTSGPISKIPKPQGELCLVSIPDELVICRDVNTKKPTRDYSLAETDKWMTMNLATFNSLNRYIDEIVKALQNKATPIEATELKQIQEHLDLLVSKLETDREQL